MKLTAISLLILALLPFASAIDFTFNYPELVKLNESFSVSISAATQEVYDVKIIVQDNKTESTISQIYNDGWKNPFFYLKSAFPNKANFDIRIINYSDDAFLCVKLRKSETTSVSEKCGLINMDKSSKSQAKTEEASNSSEQETDNNSLIIKEPTPDFVPLQDADTKTPEIVSTNEKILLNDETSSSEDKFVSKEEKIRLILIYSFAFFAILAIIVIIFRRKS